MVNRRFTYNEKEITALAVDESENFVWVAYAQDPNGNCVVKKVFGFDPNQIFFDINKSVNKINHMIIDSVNLYLAYDDDTLIGQRLSTTNPLTSILSMTIPAGINEPAISVAFSASGIFFLTPGIASGENAKIARFSTFGTFLEIIDLNKTGVSVTNASKMAVADTGDIWVGTNTDPSTIVRVFTVSGGAYDFTVTTI